MAAVESSGMKIEKLNGANYMSWKFNMKCLLMEKGLWGFVSGTVAKPEVLTVSDSYMIRGVPIPSGGFCIVMVFSCIFSDSSSEIWFF